MQEVLLTWQTLIHVTEDWLHIFTQRCNRESLNLVSGSLNAVDHVSAQDGALAKDTLRSQLLRLQWRLR